MPGVRLIMSVGVCAAMAAAGASVHAATNPYTEEFPTNAANWADGASQALTWNAAGGMFGSHVRAPANFQAITTANETLTVFRAHDDFGSSGNNFFGNYLADGVTQFSAWIHHDLPESTTAWGRFALPGNFPAGFLDNAVVVPPNTWTEIIFDVTPGNTNWELESFPNGPTIPAILSNVGKIQLGVRTPSSLTGVDQEFNILLDRVSIVPEPTTGALAMLAGLGVVTRRKRS